jgi:hypothetical protein
MPEIEVSGNQRQAFASAVVDHDQDAQTAAVDELIGDKIQRPAVVRPLRDQHRCPCAQGPLTTAAAADHKALLAIEPEQAFVVHHEALPSQQDVQAPVAEAPPHMGQTSQPCPQFCVVGPVAPISHRHPYAADRSARPPLAHVERRTKVSDSLSLGSGRHHFFASRSNDLGRPTIL